jgi:hypothetical protein
VIGVTWSGFLWVLSAIALGLVNLWVGLTALRAASGVGRVRPPEEHEVENVEDLDVFFVCGGCGTELQVTRLGQLQVPRHCGEPMEVVRRPRSLG